jgi:predicted nucleic-acid-binding Zn-ribbon protein
VKRSRTCPKCDGKDVFHSQQIMDRGEGNEALPLAIGRTDPIHAQVFGQFEVYACRGCGYAELYVLDLEELS